MLFRSGKQKTEIINTNINNKNDDSINSEMIDQDEKIDNNYQKEEKENNLLKRKKERKQNKKKKRGELLKKYQEEINKEINEDNLKNENFLVAKKKVRNEEESTEKTNKKIYKKRNIRILIENKNEKYRSVPQEVLDFKNKHLYGGRIKREKNFLGKI